MQQAFKTVKVGDDVKNIPLINQFIKTIKGGTIEVTRCNKRNYKKRS